MLILFMVYLIVSAMLITKLLPLSLKELNIIHIVLIPTIPVIIVGVILILIDEVLTYSFYKIKEKLE